MEKKRRIHKRILAALMAVAMVVSIFAPVGKSASKSFADDYINPQLVEIAADHIDVTLSNNSTTIPRNNSFSIAISYTVPQDKLEEAKRENSEQKIIWVYDLSTFIANEPALANLVDGATGNVFQGNTVRGTYTVSGNKVFLDIDKDWLLQQTSLVTGTFDLGMSLDASQLGSEDSLSFRFPGSATTTTLTFDTPSNSANNKWIDNAYSDKMVVTPNSDGTYTIDYKISVTPNTNHKTKFDVIDTLSNGKQSFVADSFRISYSSVDSADISGSTTINGQTADIDLYSYLNTNGSGVVANTTYTISYSTIVSADGLGEALTNTLYTTWENDKKSNDTTKTITPILSVDVTKTYTKVEGTDNQYEYTIVIGDGTYDLSDLNIVDNMTDLQNIVGDVTLNDSVISLANSTFTDDSYSSNTSKVFEYNTGANYGNGPITIKYKVNVATKDDAPNISGEQNIVNNVSVKGDTREGNANTSFKRDYGEGVKPSISKEFISFDAEAGRVNWKITIKNDTDSDYSDVKMTEYACGGGTNEWNGMTEENIDYDNIVVKDKAGNTVSSSLYTINTNEKSIVFTLLPANTEYTVELSSIANLVNGRYYKNEVGLYQGYTTLGTSTAVQKYNSNELDVDKSYTYDEETGIYSWTVDINSSKNEIDPDKLLYFIDEIPVGMEYISGSISIALSGKSSLNSQEYWGDSFADSNKLIAVDNSNKIGPVDVSAYLNTYQQYRVHQIGQSGIYTKVTYQTRLTDSELARVKGKVETQNYENNFKVTDSTGNTTYGNDSETATYDYSFISKTDLSGANIDDVDKDIVNFRIDVNKDGLTLNENNPLTLTDRLETSVELINKGYNGRYEFTIEDSAGNNLISSGDATLSYNDDSRTITITIPDSTYVIIKYSVRTRRIGEIQVDNTVVLKGTGIEKSDSTSEKHNVSSHSATIQGGGIQLHKIDEHYISKELPNAKFDLYEVPFDNSTYLVGTASKIAEDITSNDGYYVIPETYLDEGKLYYWQETKAPSGYVLDNTPHYFVVYTYNSTDSTSYNNAKKIDNGVQDANEGITVNTVELGSYVWTVCNRNENVVTDKGNLTIKKAFATDSDTSVHKTKYYVTVKKGNEYFNAAGESTGTTVTEVEVPTGNVGTTISNLPLGEYTISEVKSGNHSAEDTNCYLTTTIKVGDSETSTVNLTTDNNTADVVVTNKYTRKPGSINVTKTVDSPYDSDYSIEFDFKVKLNSDTFDVTKIDGEFSGIQFTDGESATFKLKHGESKTIEGLPAGVGYTVTETSRNGFTTTKTGDTGTISSTLISNVTFTNKRDTAGVRIEKSYSGINSLPENFGINYSFSGVDGITGSGTLTVADADNKDAAGAGSTVPYYWTIPNVPVGSKISISETGAYVENYNLVVNANGKNYDSVNATTVLSAEDYTVVKETETVTNSIVFTNTYERLTGSLKVEKEVVSNVADDKTNKTFSFVITMKNGNDIAEDVDGNYAAEDSKNVINAVEFKEGKATVELVHGQSVTISGLPRGYKYVVSESEPYFTSTTSSDLSGTIGETLSTVKITNTRDKGSVKIIKTFSGIDSTKIPANFQITNDYNSTVFTIDGRTGTVGSKSTNTSATGVSYEWTIDDVPAGITVTFTETNYTVDGYSLKINDFVSTVQDSNKATTDTVLRNAQASATLNNVYSNTSGNLVIMKNYHADSAIKDNTKVYYVTVKNSEDHYFSAYGEDLGTTLTESAKIIIPVNDYGITIEDLPFGTYTVTEVADSAAVQYYDLVTTYDASNVVTLASGDADKTVTVINKYTRKTGSIEISKKVISDVPSDVSADTDSITKFPITVTILKEDGSTDTSFNGDYGALTFTNGEANYSVHNENTIYIRNLPVGTKYKVEETANELFNSEIKIKDTVTTTGIGTVQAADADNKVTITNTRKTGKLSLSKKVVNTTDENDLKKEFEFTIQLGDNGITKSYGAVKTDSENKDTEVNVTFTNGKATVTLKDSEKLTISGLPVGIGYTVDETQGDGFEFIPQGTNATGTISSTVEAHFTNKRKTRDILVDKRDIATGDELEGAEITIYEGDVSGDKNPADDAKIESWTSSDKEAHTIKELEYGKIYTLRENTAPAGYDVTADTVFRITADGKIEIIGTGTIDNETGEEIIVINDKLKTRDVLVDKRDITTGDELEGAEITIYEGDVSGDKNPADDAKIESWTSSDKEAHTIKELEYGKIYTLRENTAPIGYDVTADTVFRINMDGTIEILGTGTIDNKDGKEIIVINDGLMKTDIELCKVSEKDPTKCLPDSTYVLYRVRGTAKVEIARAVTDERGIIRFKDVEAGGEYIITEVEAPDGYYISEKSIKIRVEVVKNGDGGVSVVLKAIDMGDGSNGKSTAYIDTVTGAVTWLEPEIICSVLKVDEEGKALAGAALEIRKGSADGDVIDSWTSTTDAHIVEAGLLVCGESYYLVEKSAPEGYDKAEPVKFTIEETMAAGEDKTVEVVMTDKKTETTTETTTETKTETTTKTTTETMTETTTETVIETTTTTDKVTETNTENTDTVVKTSDETPISNMVVLIFVSLAGIVFFGSKKRKNNMS